MTKKKYVPVQYFFLNGDLHRRLHINRPGNKITAWSYPEHKVRTYVYTDVLKHREKAFRLSEAAKMLNRTRLWLHRCIVDGKVKQPQYAYNFNNQKKKSIYFVREKEILDFHELFSNEHRGNHRKDGGITPYPLPSRQEIRARIRHNLVTYVKTEDGEFVPTWQAEQY